MPCDSLAAAGAVIRAARCVIMVGIYIDRVRSTDQRRIIRFFTRCFWGVSEGMSNSKVNSGKGVVFLLFYLVLSRVFIFFLRCCLGNDSLYVGFFFCTSN